MASLVTPAVVAYLAGLSRLPHPQLDVVAREGRAEGLPLVMPETGALLHALVRLTRARRVLEIGTAIGYSALWMATALPDDGQLLSLERDPARAARARAHAKAAGHEARVNVMAGDAARFLHKIAGPFDLIFQDGDKPGYLPMLDRLAAFLPPGGVLVTDNVLWSGSVVPGMAPLEDRDPADVAAIAAYNEHLVHDDRFYTVWLPVGDGVAVSTKGQGTEVRSTGVRSTGVRSAEVRSTEVRSTEVRSTEVRSTGGSKHGGSKHGGFEARMESMSERLKEFREFREKMNARILESGNLEIKRFFALDSRAYEDGALPVKTKELLGLVASLVLRCDDCVTYHIVRCREEGVTREEFLETFNVALVVGGSITIPHLRRAVATLDEVEELR
ncbi:MAG: class I SAM-dependent methyltransferase [Acidobacteria bacterium]|nr:class I SAM-dependent methyltransferase [Acidobacteriota bacterium]